VRGGFTCKTLDFSDAKKLFRTIEANIKAVKSFCLSIDFGENYALDFNIDAVKKDAIKSVAGAFVAQLPGLGFKQKRRFNRMLDATFSGRRDYLGSQIYRI
jgi:hypothetical protein